MKLDVAEKQRLLAELDVDRRAQLLLQRLSELVHDQEAAAVVQFPPEFSPN